MLHASTDVSAGHAAPFPVGCVTTVRYLVIVPPPQSTLQVPADCHAETVQSTSHGATLHGAVDCVAPGHVPAVPLGSEVFTIVRMRVCVPPPHATVHAALGSQSE